VHWRSTARTGELMVRREEQPWESRATIVLDTRLQGHRGEGPTSSFEWAVSAAASIALHLRRNGYKIRLVTGGQASGDGNGVDLDATESDGEGALMDCLADVNLSAASPIPSLVGRVRRTQRRRGRDRGAGRAGRRGGRVTARCGQRYDLHHA
jgi:hypothetical protein